MYEIYAKDLKLPEKPKSLQEIHDDFARQSRRLATQEYFFDLDEKVLNLDDAGFENYKIVVPKSNYKLIEFGEQLSNCIASYANYMKTKYCLLLGIEKDGILTYNLEIRNKNIAQFVGKHNARPPKEEIEKVRRFLVDKKVIYDTVEISNY